MQTHTILKLDGNAFEEVGRYFTDGPKAKGYAEFLSAQALADAKADAASVIGASASVSRFIAVRTLSSINHNTTASELSKDDLLWLAGEVVDTCDFYLVAPDWSKAAIESVPERRFFSEKYKQHVLSAIRCALSVNRKLVRQVEKDEALQVGGRKY